MANLALSTQIPQIGDSSQQLLARMAAAAADQVQQISSLTWLASGTRSTSQSLILTVPPGVVGIKVFANLTAVPGVSTLTLLCNDADSDTNLSGTASSAAVGPMILISSRGVCYTYPTSSSGINIGLSDRIVLYVAQSGAGSFTYSVKYIWLKK